MFKAHLISLSRGQSYSDVEVLEYKHGDFERLTIPSPFGSRTVAFFHRGELILAHPWGVRLIHLDHKPRGSGPKCFEFDRIILDGDISYADGVYIDDDYFAEYSIPDLFEDPGEVIDQVSFSCNQGVFITHDANVVSIIKKHPRKTRGVTKSENPNTAYINRFTADEGLKHKKINRRN
jgi:hypothetical protein